MAKGKGFAVRCRVQIDRRCRFDVGERTPERRALIAQDIRTIGNLLGEHQGHPPGSFHDTGQPSDQFVWEDQNWRVVYRNADERYLIVRKRRTITQLAIDLRR